MLRHFVKTHRALLPREHAVVHAEQADDLKGQGAHGHHVAEGDAAGKKGLAIVHGVQALFEAKCQGFWRKRGRIARKGQLL